MVRYKEKKGFNTKDLFNNESFHHGKEHVAPGQAVKIRGELLRSIELIMPYSCRFVFIRG